MNKIALTVDVEDWYHSPIVTGSTFSKYNSVEEFFEKWNGKFDYLTEPTERVLNLLELYDLKATFFIVADIVDNYPQLVEKIVNKGHEIACHGLHHEMIVDEQGKPRQNSSDLKRNIRLAKEKLERISKEKVIGFRAPSAYIGGWMLDVLEDIGFKYDSSVCVNSIYSKMDKKPESVTTVPYYPIKGSLEIGKEKRNLLEIPWPYWKVLGFKFPTAGGPFLRYGGARYIVRGLEQSLKRGDTVFYFHPLDLSEEKFPIASSKKRPFFWYGKGRRVEKSLRYIFDRYSQRGLFTTCREIREKWDDI